MRAMIRKDPLEFNSVNLPSIAHEIISLVHSDAVLRNVRVSLDVGRDLQAVRGDKIQLQQVFLNLMLNAFDAMEDCPPENREARVQVASDGEGQIAVSVRDRGPGLTDEKLGRIFEPFYTTKRNGLGMGLSISRSIIEAHGGKLWAENNADGAGATFYLTLPPETRKKADDGIVDYWADLLRNGK
jgi:two-component system sensor kinase FixL